MRLPFLSTINREVRGMHQAAYVLAAFAFGSQLLALVRDRLLAAQFGASHTLDVYYAAFRVPDFLFATVASLLSLYALLPVLSRLEEKHAGSTLSFLRGSLLLFFVGMAVIAGGLFVCAPLLAPLVAPGLAGPQLVLLIRVLLLQPILLGASNILAAFTQLRHRFVLYSVSPLLYNLGIIVGILVLYPRFGIAGLGWGVVLGALLHFLVQLPFFVSQRTEHSMSLREKMAGLKEVLLLSVPRTLTLAASQITLLILVSLASSFSAGSIAVFMFAYNLQAVPLTIIGVSYSVAAFPTLARLFAKGEKKAFTQHIEVALRHIMLWSILATVFIIVLRAQLVRAILGAGAFDWTATRLTAAALALFVISLVAQSSTLLIARAYYAAGNTLKPLLWGTCEVLMSVTCAVGGVFLFKHSLFTEQFVESLLRVESVSGAVVLMLAFGYAVGSTLRFLVSLYFFVRDFGLSLRSLLRLCFEIFAGSVIGSFVSYGTLATIGHFVDINTTLGIVAEGAVAGVFGLMVTMLILRALGNSELEEALLALHKRFIPQSVALEPTDIESS